MANQQQRKGPNSFSYMILNNQNSSVTYPVAVDYTFLNDLFNIERSYDGDSVMMFRRNSHPVRKNHVTEMSIRLMMTIFRRFNTEGALVGVPVHRLFQMMNEEYEDAGSKEQFYAEIRKFIELGLISTKKKGIIYEWRIESFKRKTGRFVLFNPLVFTKAFTDLSVSAQKLYLYIVSRNGEKVNTEFKEFLGHDSWIYTLTHKTRPAQMRDLLESLSSLEPQGGHPLLTESAISKDSLGRWSLRCVPNPVYQVRHEANQHYRAIPKAKVPYSKTVGRLRQLLSYFKIRELEEIDHGQTFLRLVQLLQNKGFKTLRFAVSRLRELFEKGMLFDVDPVLILQSELDDRAYQAYIDVAKNTGVYRFIPHDDDAYVLARPFQFFRAIREHFSIRQFKSICQRAALLLDREKGVIGTEEDFYLEEWLIARFGGTKQLVHA